MPAPPGAPHPDRHTRAALVATLTPEQRRAILWLAADGSPRTRDADAPPTAQLRGLQGAAGEPLAEQLDPGTFRLLPLGQAVRANLVEEFARELRSTGKPPAWITLGGVK